MKILVKAKKIQLTASGSVDVDVDKEEEEEEEVEEEEETLEERRKSLAKLSLRQVFQHSIDAEDLPRWFDRSISKAFCFCPLGFPKENLQCNNKKTQGEDLLKSEGLKTGRCLGDRLRCPGDHLRCPGDQLRRRFCRKKPRKREQRRRPPHNLDNSATWSTILVSFNFNVFYQRIPSITEFTCRGIQIQRVLRRWSTFLANVLLLWN